LTKEKEKETAARRSEIGNVGEINKKALEDQKRKKKRLLRKKKKTLSTSAQSFVLPFFTCPLKKV
jgi:hypothetical protein